MAMAMAKMVTATTTTTAMATVTGCNDDDDNGGGGPLCRSRRWLVVALLSATRYCCRSLHAVMRSPTLSSQAAFTAFASPVVGWYLHCRPPPGLVIAHQCAIFNSLIAALPPDALVTSRHPPVPFPLMVGCCVVVCHPFSLSYPFVAALPPDALVSSRRPPVPFPLMVGCCIVVCHLFSLSHPCFCRRTLS